MENSITKTKKSTVEKKSKSTGSRKRITEVDILRKAYEIYMENSDLSAKSIDDLFRDGRELEESGSVGSSAGNHFHRDRYFQL
jgi:hypothetical protein